MAAGFLLVILGAACFVCFPGIAGWEQSCFEKKEPVFEAPVAPVQNVLTIRADKYGKGHFGASRNGGRMHQGVDFLTPVGSPALAVKTGRVIFAGEEKGYGYCVKILHVSGQWTSVYAHLSQVFVVEGQWVIQHQTIGLAGKTGNATDSRIKPHLHFELRNFDKSQDPAPLLNPSIQIKK